MLRVSEIRNCCQRWELALLGSVCLLVIGEEMVSLNGTGSHAALVTSTNGQNDRTVFVNTPIFSRMYFGVSTKS